MIRTRYNASYIQRSSCCAAAVVLIFAFAAIANSQDGVLNRTPVELYAPSDSFLAVAIDMCAVEGNIADTAAANQHIRTGADNVTIFVGTAHYSELLENVVVVQRHQKTADRTSVFANAGKDLFMRSFDYERSTYQGSEVHYPRFSGSSEYVEAGLFSPTVMFADQNVVVLGAKNAVHRLIDNLNNESSGRSLAKDLDSTCDIHAIYRDSGNTIPEELLRDFATLCSLTPEDLGQLKAVDQLEVRVNLDGMIPIQVDIRLKSNVSERDFTIAGLSGPVLLETICKLIDSLSSEDIPDDAIRKLKELGDELLADVEVTRSDGHVYFTFRDPVKVRAIFAEVHRLLPFLGFQ